MEGVSSGWEKDLAQFRAFPQGKNNLVAGVETKDLLVLFGLKKSFP